MIDINIGATIEVLVKRIFDNKSDKRIRKEILNHISDKHYDIACKVFHMTREAFVI